MRVLLPYGIAAGFFLLLALFWRIALLLNRQDIKRAALSDRFASADSIVALLEASFGTRNVFSRLAFPAHTRYGTEPLPVDCIVLLRGAVAVLKIEPRLGVIRTSASLWHQSVSENGRMRESDFPSPVSLCERQLGALIGVWEQEKIDFDPHPIGLAVFPSDAEFAFARPRGVESARTIVPALRRADSTFPPFSREERKKLVRSFRRRFGTRRRASPPRDRKRPQ